MPTVTRFVFACAAGILLAASGCAPAYYDYLGCYIDCKYCPLPPLPYTQYNDCVCRSCAASRHLAIQPAPVDTEEGGSENMENIETKNLETKY